MEPEERAALVKPSATSRRAKSATVVYEPPVPEAAAIDGVKQVSKKMRRTKIWEGHPKARAKAEAAEKELWVGQVVALLREMGVDALAEAAQQVDPEASLRRVCSHLRGPTLHMCKLGSPTGVGGWFAVAFRCPPSRRNVTRYLETRAAGVCTALVIKRTVAALRFFEFAACIHPD